MGGAAGDGGAAGSAGTGGGAGQTGMSSFKLRMENVSASTALPSPIAPGVWAIHRSADPLFSSDAPDAGEGLEALAEDGDPSVLAAALTEKAGIAAGAFNTPAGASAAGPAVPGDAYEVVVTASPGDKLSFATMLVQSNDLFFANSGAGIALFDQDGMPLPSRDVTGEVDLWNAGTEKDEAPGFGAAQAPRQPSMNFGPAEGVVSKRLEPTRAIPIPSALVKVSVMESDGMYTIALENTSRSGAVLTSPLSPVFYATHDSSWQLFSVGAQASAGLEQLAEDGDPSQLATEYSGAAGVGTAAGAGTGIATPGESIAFSVTPSASAPRLSLATMLVQSNDVFIGTRPEGVALLNPMGMPRSAADVEVDLMASLATWDAGTEANEAPGVGANQAPRQAVPNTGPADPDDTVRLYSDTTNDLEGSLLAAWISVSIKNAGGSTFDVSVTNSSGASGFPGLITPVVWAIHDASVGLFEMGKPASAGLESLAEDGDPMKLLGELSAVAAVSASGVEGMAPAASGSGFNFQVTASTTHRFLSIGSMVVPSNDSFLALGQTGVELLTSTGSPRSDADITADVAELLAVFDAGTEQNQAGAAGPDMAGPGLQAGPNTGASEGNGTVRKVDVDLWPLPAASRLLRVTLEPM